MRYLYLSIWHLQRLSNSTTDKYYLSYKRLEIDPIPSNPLDLMVYYIKISEELKSVSAVFQANSAIRHFHLTAFPDLLSPTESNDVKIVVENKIRDLQLRPKSTISQQKIS